MVISSFFFANVYEKCKIFLAPLRENTRKNYLRKTFVREAVDLDSVNYYEGPGSIFGHKLVLGATFWTNCP